MNKMLFTIFLIIFTLHLTEGQWNETIIRQIRPIKSASFDEIIIDGAFDVFLSQSDTISNSTVELEASASGQKYIVVEILDNHILSIRIKGSLITHKNIKAWIRFNSPLKRYTIKGTGNTATNDNGLSNPNEEKFILDNRGTANIAMKINIHEFEVLLSGTGNSRFWGNVRECVTINTKGVGDINTLNLSTKKVKVRSTGVSTVRVAASDDVDIEVNGVSTVYYRLPNGQKPSKEVSIGLGQIIRLS